MTEVNSYFVYKLKSIVSFKDKQIFKKIELYLRKQKKQRKLESANNVDRNLKFSSSHTGIDIQKLKFRHRGLALQCAMRNHFIELKIKVSSIELSIFDWL